MECSRNIKRIGITMDISMSRIIFDMLIGFIFGVIGCYVNEIWIKNKTTTKIKSNLNAD